MNKNKIKYKKKEKKEKKKKGTDEGRELTKLFLVTERELRVDDRESSLLRHPSGSTRLRKTAFFFTTSRSMVTNAYVVRPPLISYSSAGVWSESLGNQIVDFIRSSMLSVSHLLSSGHEEQGT